MNDGSNDANPTTTLAKAGVAENSTTQSNAPATMTAPMSVNKASLAPGEKTTTPIAKAATTTSQPIPAQKTTSESITALGSPGNGAYLIGPQDVVEITVFKVSELSKTIQVSETGNINLPLLGSVTAAGRTAHQLEQELTKSLGAKYLQKPQVNITVKEYNSQRVTLEGSGIKRPGVYPLRGRMSLLQLIATAEGLSEISDSQVAVFRQKGPKRAAVRFDVAAIRTGEAEDPVLQPGDIIVASSSAGKEAFNNVMKALPLATILRPF